jgi:hypothetical protein
MKELLTSSKEIKEFLESKNYTGIKRKFKKEFTNQVIRGFITDQSYLLVSCLKEETYGDSTTVAVTETNEHFIPTIKWTTLAEIEAEWTKEENVSTFTQFKKLEAYTNNSDVRFGLITDYVAFVEGYSNVVGAVVLHNTSDNSHVVTTLDARYSGKESISAKPVTLSNRDISVCYLDPFHECQDADKRCYKKFVNFIIPSSYYLHLLDPEYAQVSAISPDFNYGVCTLNMGAETSLFSNKEDILKVLNIPCTEYDYDNFDLDAEYVIKNYDILVKAN